MTMKRFPQKDGEASRKSEEEKNEWNNKYLKVDPGTLFEILLVCYNFEFNSSFFASIKSKSATFLTFKGSGVFGHSRAIRNVLQKSCWHDSWTFLGKNSRKFWTPK